MALIIPKNNADAATLDATLKVYYDANDWVENETLIDQLSGALIELGIEDERKEPQSYTKKTQVLAYFGFITWEDLADKQSRRKITPLGVEFYEARVNNNRMQVIDVLVRSLTTQTFGRNVIGCDSDSDIEAPNVFIKASLLLGGLSNKQFAYILGEMELGGKDFDEALLTLKLSSYQNINAELRDEAKKWADPKPITALKNWGLIDSDNGCIPRDVINAYGQQLLRLRTKNTEALRFIAPSDNEVVSTGDIPLQIVYFGAPGTGKSHEIDENVKIKSTSQKNKFRTIFHPESDYSSFVGCYKPSMNEEGDKILYSYTAQVFTKAYIRAWQCFLTPDCPESEKNVYLVIEEINRGNCAQIFGDLFQLLDRDQLGYSKYSVTAETDLAKHLAKELKLNADVNTSPLKDWKTNCKKEAIINGEALCLPPNLFIVATMNTSDQGLFPMDSAFKRRWQWKHIPIKRGSQRYEIEVAGNAHYNWWSFLENVNKRIEKVTSSSDKKLGYWFVKPDGNTIDLDTFVCKVVSYLWTDVFKNVAKNNDNNIFRWGQAGTKENYSFDSFFNSTTGQVDDTIVREFLEGLDLGTREKLVVLSNNQEGAQKGAENPE